MKSEIETLCDQIAAAANAVYVRGCDDIAVSNLAQLRGICQAANRIKEISKKGDKDNA